MPTNADIVENYVAETELTASNVFNPENVGTIEFTGALAAVIKAAQEMDKFKKALFRRRSREESGLAPLPEDDVPLWDALGEESVKRFDDLFHGIVGSITEVGEQAEILYALLTEDAEPDIVNVREEIGDNLWYLARLVKFAKTSFPAEMEANIAKLRARHGTEGFSKEGDINRNLDNEREVLASHGNQEHDSVLAAAGIPADGVEASVDRLIRGES